jgi:predicted lipid-binding transport protein (Tim44 family)
MMTGGLPVDLILFAMIAAFLVLRLRSVLGKRTGFERPLQPETRAAGFDPRNGAIDGSFEPNSFLDGAETAFRMIVTAFAAGDRQTLRSLLSDDTYAGFEQAITARENAGESQRTELRAVHELAIEAADLRGNIADVTIRFVTDQINLTTGRNGEVVTGSDAVTELTDVWTFQRDLSQADPTWRLVATRSA